MVFVVAQLRQHPHAPGADVGRRRVQQRAVIGKRNILQEHMIVIGVERTPASVIALHADDPFGAAFDGLAVFFGIGPVQRHDNDGGIIDIRIIVVPILKGPTAARPGARRSNRPGHQGFGVPAAIHWPCSEPDRLWSCRIPASRARPGRYPKPAIGTAGNSPSRRAKLKAYQSPYGR